MSQHRHPAHVEGCFRCDLSADEGGRVDLMEALRRSLQDRQRRIERDSTPAEDLP